MRTMWYNICQRDYATNNTALRVEQWRCATMIDDSWNNAWTLLYRSQCCAQFTFPLESTKQVLLNVCSQQLIVCYPECLKQYCSNNLRDGVKIYNSCDTWCIHKYVQLMYSAGPLGQDHNCSVTKELSWAYNTIVTTELGILQDGWMDG